MIRIKILSIGKTREAWLEEAIAEYTKRLSPDAQIQFVWAKDDDNLLELIQKEQSVICLDAAGKSLTSEQFSSLLQREGSRITFVIGGAEGLPPILKEQFPLISLSPMTFTHQMTRLILLEQIYRAFQIAKRTKYHK